MMKFKFIFLLPLILLLQGCKKRLQKEQSTVTIKAVNPVNGDTYSGLKYVIREYEDAGSSVVLSSLLTESEDSPVMEGETDENGEAVVNFYKKKHHDFGYIVLFDFTEIDAPGEYKVLNNYGEEELDRGSSNEYEYNYEIVLYGEYYIHIKNTNCFDANDRMRMRYKYLYTGSKNWTFWEQAYGNEGCFEAVTVEPVRELQDYKVIEMEITKNGQTTYKLDTFYIDPNTVDTLKLYY